MAGDDVLVGADDVLVVADDVLVGADDGLAGADDVGEWTGRDWKELFEELAARVQKLCENER